MSRTSSSPPPADRDSGAAARPGRRGRAPLALSAALAVGVAACAGTGGPGAAPPPVAAGILYVCVQDAAHVAMVDMATLQVVGSLDLGELGFGPNAMPHHVAVEPDGSHWYVSLIGENRVLRLNGRNEVVGQTTLTAPGMLAFAPGGELVVTRSMSAVNPPASVGIVGADEWGAGAPAGGAPVAVGPGGPPAPTAHQVDVLFPRPHGVVVDRAGRYAYTASLGQNRIAAIDLATERIEFAEIPGPVHSIVQMAISPDGRTLVATGELSGALLVFDLSDPAHPRHLATVPVGTQPFDPLFAPDGATVWIPVKGTDEVVVVETEGWRVATRIYDEDLRQPHALVFSPDGSRVFVTNNDKDPHAMHEAPAGGGAAGVPGADAAPAGPPVASLVVIDARERRVEAAIPLGPNLTGLGHR